MNWQQICEDPSLQDLPYKIETNEYGQIVMSPASNQHGRFQGRILILLSQQLPLGEAISESSIATERGVKVADVVWISPEFLGTHGYTTPYPVAPEICVEVCSPSNSEAELLGKRQLYFDQGALEVWFCDSFGNVEFFEASGPLEVSRLVPGFPDHV